MTDDNFWVGHLHAYRHDATTGNVMLDSMIDEPGAHHRWSVCVLLDRAEQVDLAAFLLTLIFSTPDTKEPNDHE
ncbi:hypothetical protein IAG44_40015 [Streptomyces roseirectus]|uniref:Uncharacterized protein n=1 Tax=Streptomyces roseirectus TaxID=2768066 RepID=A0A7H0IQD1_9ACTN|nr:hypothetical protein [Streptomyces roseirectus]QNP74997.1 hypothetical protein IAG44_40015 [Streptomyces roseirectus]